jgi:hypothetical protein
VGRAAAPRHHLRGGAVALAVAALVPAQAWARGGDAVECMEGVEPLPIAYGSHTTGCSISPATDLDRFSFVGLAGDVVRVCVLSLTGGFDPRLEWRDPNGALIHDSFCDAPGCCAGCSRLVELTLEATGEYTLSLSDAGMDQGGSYLLQVERIPPFGTIPAVAFGTTVSSGVSPQCDLDFFAFEAAADSLVRVTVLSTTGGYDPRLELWDPTGAKIHDEFCDAPGCCAGCLVTEDLALPMPGLYVLAISDSGIDQTGNYQLSLQCLDGNCACFEYDINDDDQVGFVELLCALSNWGPCGDDCPPCDFNRDGGIGFGDLLLCLNSWGSCN